MGLLDKNKDHAQELDTEFQDAVMRAVVKSKDWTYVSTMIGSLYSRLQDVTDAINNLSRALGPEFDTQHSYKGYVPGINQSLASKFHDLETQIQALELRIGDLENDKL